MADELTRTDDSSREGALAQGNKPSHLGGRISIDDLIPPDDNGRWRIVLGAIAAVVGILSFFVLGAHFSQPETFGKTVAALDAKKDTVMSLIGASTGSSAAISLLPGDAGTPIAEKLVDLSSDFLIVLAAIYLEKYLLTILGFASFRVLIPIACALAIGALAFWNHPSGRAALSKVSFKLILFALAVFCVVPASVFVSGMIEDTYEASIKETIEVAQQTTDAIEESAEEGKSTDANNPLSFLLNMPEELNKLTESARNSLNNFIEALAVMVVTSCIIPILVLLFFVWLARIILGINIDLPPVTPRSLGRRRRRL